MTAAKLTVGKAVAKSDETYIAKAKLDEAFKKQSKYLNVTGLETHSNRDLEKTVVSQQREIVDLKESVSDLTKRLDIVTNAMDRLRIRYIYQYGRLPLGMELTNQEIERILEAERKTVQKLEKEGLVAEE
ncbi:hypothetical protein MUO79_04835 [Candidatus Bathyarchaeota archaeon]|nr:hypothetical protein [Candidatus Bathyarchaeota archaeon]